MRFDYTRASIGWSNYNGLFKLRLTDRRLLLGLNLTSWYLLELPLREIITAEIRIGPWLLPGLRLTSIASAGAEPWDIRLHKREEFERLVAALRTLGVPFAETPAAVG